MEEAESARLLCVDVRGRIVGGLCAGAGRAEATGHEKRRKS